MPHYYINNNFCKAQDIDDDFNLLIIEIFYKLVNNDKNWVIVIIFLIC